MTPERLKQIEERANAATPGPWEREIGYHDNGLYIDGELVASTRGGAVYWEAPQTDIIFIAHAREDIPALIAEIRRLQALLDERNQPKLDLHIDASNTRWVSGGEAPLYSFEIKSDKRSAWEYNDELHAYVCHYSPRSDYRLVVCLMHTDRDYWYETQAEWLVGGSLWLGEFHDLDEAQEAAIAWAEKYEGQR